MSKETLEKVQELKDYLVSRGHCQGPIYSDKGQKVIWYDQLLAFAADPAASIVSPMALHAGGSNNGLIIVLAASDSNSQSLSVAASSSFTLTLLQSDSEDGEFSAIGPTICLTSPNKQMDFAPGETILTFPCPEPLKPWIKAQLDITGTVSGNVDLGLAYMPR